VCVVDSCDEVFTLGSGIRRIFNKLKPSKTQIFRGGLDANQLAKNGHPCLPLPSHVEDPRRLKSAFLYMDVYVSLVSGLVLTRTNALDDYN
jgi:hypothetical protein